MFSVCRLKYLDGNYIHVDDSEIIAPPALEYWGVYKNGEASFIALFLDRRDADDFRDKKNKYIKSKVSKNGMRR